MDKKYWVPALERAHEVIELVSREPKKWKMGDMSKKLGISKSTLFSLLLTMEALKWVAKDTSDTYSLGSHFGTMGNAFFRQYDLVEMFHKEAASTLAVIQESIQMARLEGSHVLYLTKINGSSPIQMVSGPGARILAHATGLGKMLLSSLLEEEINARFPEEKLEQLTPYTIATRSELLHSLEEIRKNGYALDLQEGVMGFCCAAAPIYNVNGQMIASVSISMPMHEWLKKQQRTIQEVCDLAARLSFAN